jgi:hypothetical protein
MTSDSDDLIQELRKNLKLRRELGGEASKLRNAMRANQGGGIAYRLGWVLYWACLVGAGAWVAFFLWWAWGNPGVVEDVRRSPYLAILVAAPSLLLYGLGRAARYVLAAE